MKIDTLVDQIVDSIRTKIVEGSKMLESVLLRMEIDDALRRNKYDARLLQMNASELMTEFVKASIIGWPTQLEWAFQTVEERLKSLQEIATILDPKKLNEWVHISDDHTCRIKDPRMSVKDFKKMVWERLFGFSYHE